MNSELILPRRDQFPRHPVRKTILVSKGDRTGGPIPVLEATNIIEIVSIQHHCDFECSSSDKVKRDARIVEKYEQDRDRINAGFELSGKDYNRINKARVALNNQRKQENKQLARERHQNRLLGKYCVLENGEWKHTGTDKYEIYDSHTGFRPHTQLIIPPIGWYHRHASSVWKLVVAYIDEKYIDILLSESPQDLDEWCCHQWGFDDRLCD